MNEFTTWANLATYGGSLAMVLVFTQLTKEITKKIPTQLWSYILSFGVLLTATYFTGALTVESGVLLMFNAAIVSLAANGGFEAVQRLLGGGKDD